MTVAPRNEPQKESNHMTQQTFPDLGVSRPVTNALAKRGITEPFPIQAMVLADGMAGHDLLAKSRTGSGKTTAFGGVGIPEQAKRAAKAHILVATPGRLEDIASRKLVKLDAVRILVLDEADRMLDMGFQPQVDTIVRRIPTERQTMLFSATLDDRVARLARAYTRNPRR